MRNSDDTATQRLRPGKPANDNVSHPVPRSWAPEVHAEGAWVGNAIRFATRAEAESYASALLMRWFVPNDARAVPSTDDVNYTLARDGSLIAVSTLAEVAS